MRHRRLWLTIAALLVAFVVGVVPRVYRIRAIGSEAELFWTSEEAFVFMTDVRIGYDRSVAAVLRDVALELLYTPPGAQGTTITPTH